MRRQACAALLFILFPGVELVAQDWPPLPTTGFIGGRVATPADVAAGNAVFAASVSGGATGKSTPLRIRIPQYAYHRRGQAKIPVIVLQAERVDIQRSGETVQMTTVAAVGPDGKKFIDIRENFELLGQLPPR
jgi:hypothetical protein